MTDHDEHRLWMENRVLNGLNCLLATNQFCLFGFGITCNGDECFEKWQEMKGAKKNE